MGTTYKELFKLYDLIQCGDTKSVDRFLSNNNINVNLILPSKGISVLHLAVGIEPLEKSKECTELLLKYGGDPNMCNDDGVTPVHIAAIWGRVDNLKLLIGCGGDPARRDVEGYSSFDYAAREQQWPVYDYLHNVVDQMEDSWGSDCAYTLDLDKVLVTTDQMVAEYGCAADNEICRAATSRNSDMVRQWCEKSGLVMNKLYPTILTDTYTLEDESVLCKSTDLSLDVTRERNGIPNDLNETNATFKTCLSTKSGPHEVEISGVCKLDLTSDRSKESTSTDRRKQRLSVYENFSLPGSPNTITHTNYNSKSNLKSNKLIQGREALVSEFHKMSLDAESLMTDDSSQTELDKALVVVQNKTNEWLSSYSDSRLSDSSDRAGNTRRSSASSGVSSNFSGGSIVIANIHEDYKYEDKEEDVVLIERRLLLSSVVLPVDETVDSNTADQTILSVASSLPPSMEYDNATLRAELEKLGFSPGPIQQSTRTLYLKKLEALKKNPIVVKQAGKTYSVELEKSLRTDDWMRNLSQFAELERRAQADFANGSKKWREGTAKTSFTYLLLDPRRTRNLPARAAHTAHTAQHDTWLTFVDSIFYVGKGKRSRPYSHLYQAVTLWKSKFTASKDKKVQHILDIWSEHVGVICLHIFQNVIPAEAYTYEAAMIDVLGLQNLKNLKTGNYYGVAASWPLKDRRQLGLYLLYKAMLIFLSEGERQLQPDDID